MKRLISLIIAGMSGGLIVLGGILLVQGDLLTGTKHSNVQFTSSPRVIEEKIPEDFADAAEAAMPAVVHISAEAALSSLNDQRSRRRDPLSFFFGDDFFGSPQPRSGKGSGVIISEDGYIVTNNHVIDFADQLEVTLFDDRKFKATLIGQDPRTDIAVIKIDTDNLPFLKFGDSDEIRVGEWVLAVGNPFDLTSTVTAGIISAKGRNKIIKRNDAIEDFIQTDAVVNPGNSGGALVNTEGDLIGVNTAIATATGYYAGYSFAIPSNMLQPVVENIIEHGGPRVFLGLYVAAIADYEAYEEIDLEVDQGVVVTQVEDGGAAQYAGILPADVIVKIDGQDVKSADNLVKIMQQFQIGDEVVITISRKGKVKKVNVRLKA